VSSHQLSEVQQSVDHVVIISRGRAVYQGSLETLERGSVVRVDSAEHPRLLEALRAAGLVVDSHGAALLVTGSTPQQVGSIALAAGVALTLLMEESIGLEDVFLDLVGAPAEEEAA